MNILLIYPNKGSRGSTPIGVGMVSAFLKREGHDVELFDTTFYKQGEKTEKEIGEQILDFKKVDLEEAGATIEEVDIIKKLQEKIEKFKPSLIAFSFLSTQLIGEEEYDMARRGIELINKLPELKIPVLVGGLHPTFASEEILNQERVSMICRGECEEALVELANKMEKREDISSIRNIWIKKKNKEGEVKIIKNPLRPLIQNLDDMPFIDYSIFSDKSFLRPYEGRVVRGVDFELSRGCPYNCTYCPTTLVKGLYENQKYHREKSVKRIIGEIKHLKERYGINFIKFHDENFLTINEEKLGELAPLFKKEIGIPFVTEVRPEAITKRKAELLKEMGCVSASIGIECGNEEFRSKVLNRHMSNKAIKESIKYLKDAKVRTRTFNMIGLPYETRELIMETIKLNKEAGADSCAVSYFSPFKGTQLRDLCIKKGFMKESSYLTPTREDTILNLPEISKKEIRGLQKTFNMYVNSPEWLYPLIKEAGEENEFSNRLFKILQKIFYNKIHG